MSSETLTRTELFEWMDLRDACRHAYRRIQDDWEGDFAEVWNSMDRLDWILWVYWATELGDRVPIPFIRDLPHGVLRDVQSLWAKVTHHEMFEKSWKSPGCDVAAWEFIMPGALGDTDENADILQRARVLIPFGELVATMKKQLEEGR